MLKERRDADGFGESSSWVGIGDGFMGKVSEPISGKGDLLRWVWRFEQVGRWVGVRLRKREGRGEVLSEIQG